MSIWKQKQKTFSQSPFFPVFLSALIILLTSSIGHAAQVSLGWNKSTQDIVKWYKVYCGTSSGGYTIVTDSGAATTCTLDNLEQGKTYYFAASAYDAAGAEGPVSDEISYTIPLNDADGDGIPDSEESVYGTDPGRADTDGDGISDQAELAYWQDRWNEDADNDGIINLLDQDSDNDGIPDGAEIDAGSDPTDEFFPLNAEGRLAINAGGAEYTDREGQTFRADIFHSEGTAKPESSASVSGTDDPTPYQSERWGSFSYAVPLPNGDYDLTIKLAEIYWTEPGQRVFDILIEGSETVTDLDLVQTAGANVAHDVTTTVTVTDGVLDLEFSADINHAKLSALVIQRHATNEDNDGDGIFDLDEEYTYGTDPAKADSDNDGIADGDELTLWGDDWSLDIDGDGLINILDPDADGDGTLDGAELAAGTDPAVPETPEVPEEPETPTDPDVVFAMNAGDGAYTATDGTTYVADTGFTGGTAKAVRSDSAPIEGTEDDPLYQSERWGTFAYNIPMANGNYIVTLKFAEIYWSEPGRRIFDATVEGEPGVIDLDLVEAAGADTAYDVEIPVTITDGVLDIDFNTDVNHSKLSAVLVTKDAVAVPDTPETVFAVNAGGSRYVDAQGNVFDADRLFLGGTGKDATDRIGEIAQTEDDFLYRSERWGTFGYAIPLANGTYDIVIKCAEIFWSDPDKRIFDITAEGRPAATGLDLVAEVGSLTAHDVSARVEVTDGELNLDFTATKNHGQVAAILVRTVVK